jgi:hypothetical protein
VGRLGLVAACVVLVAFALVLVFVREERGPVRVTRDAPSTTRASGDPPAGLEVAAAAGADEPVRTESAALRATRIAEDAVEPRGEIHGRLVEAESGVPLAAEKLVLLASPGNTVAETLRTSADGSFTSTRRFPRGPVRAWVSEPDSRALLGRHEAQFDPEDAREWLVPVPPAPELEGPGTALHGLVVDLDGRAVEGATVKLFPLGAPGKVDCGSSTSASGEFDLQELEAGPHRLLVQGRFVSSAPLDLALVEGQNDAGRILLPAAPPAGALRGRLLCEDGRGDPFAALLLRELDSGKQLAVPSDWTFFSEDDGITSFEIPDLPGGQYELAVVPLDGREYEPPFLRASPPADGLEFRARVALPRANRLRVRDAESGAELQGFVMLGRIRGQWTPRDLGPKGMLPGSFDRWVVYAEGHRPARGDFAGAAEVEVTGEDGAEVHEVEVSLERGHGLAVLFRDIASDRLLAPEFEDLLGAALEGVTVLADGEPLARSDEEGLAVLDLPREGAQLSFERPGWRVVGEREVEGALLVHLARD